MAKSTVEFFFDPVCPFTWVTSRWLVKAAEERGFAIKGRPFCLKFKNEKNASEKFRKSHDIGLASLRVFVSISKELGDEAAWKFYDEWGAARFPAGLQDDAPDLEAVLMTAGLDAKFLASADDDAIDGYLREELSVAIELAGNGVGSPIISLPETNRGFFGPVITDIPQGENVGKLWDAVNVFFSMPEFREFKRDNGQLPIASL